MIEASAFCHQHRQPISSWSDRRAYCADATKADYFSSNYLIAEMTSGQDFILVRVMRLEGRPAVNVAYPIRRANYLGVYS
jgi:hypothetical protein